MNAAYRFLCIALFMCLIFISTETLAQPYPASDGQEGRYVLLVVGGSNTSYQRSYIVNKTPALVLDSVLGIVWRCKNLQDDRPLWVKTDLAKNKDKARLAKKYIIKTLDYFGSEPKVPAVVLDIEEGRIWICSNIMDEAASWAQKDLVQEEKIEESKYKY